MSIFVAGSISTNYIQLCVYILLKSYSPEALYAEFMNVLVTLDTIYPKRISNSYQEILYHVVVTIVAVMWVIAKCTSV